MKIIITEEERKNILDSHKKQGYNTIEPKINILSTLKEEYSRSNIELVQKALKNAGYNIGNSGPKKDGIDGKFGNVTSNAVYQYQKSKGLKSDGQVGPCTAKSLGVNPLVGSGPCKDPNVKKGSSDSTKTDSTSTGIKVPVGYDCIAIDADTCKKISPSTQVSIGTGSEKQCTAYARKCLSEYGIDSLGGSAWEALSVLKGKGATVKYNIFDSYDWSKLQNSISKLGINQKSCECFDKTPTEGNDVDKKCDGGKLGSAISMSYPNTSGVNVGDLKLGDIVGMYWRGSSNKGKAFCQKAKVDASGKITNPKTVISTHLGFVGAIKNGEPIIFHNVHGTYYATPAKNYLNKSADAMITWVATDPDLKHSIGIQKGTEEKTVTDYGKDAYNYISKLFS